MRRRLLPQCPDSRLRRQPLRHRLTGWFPGLRHPVPHPFHRTLLRSTGHFSVVHNFTPADGCGPTAIPLLQGTDGNLYGATTTTIYRVSVGLPPYLKPVLINGTVGSPLTILGNGLTDATSVTFNGVAATFTVVSDTEITTNIPTGATTGASKL